MLIGWEEYNYFINCTAVQLMIFPKQTKWRKGILVNTNVKWNCPRGTTGCIKKRRPLEIKHIVKIWMPFQLHIYWTVVREILMNAYRSFSLTWSVAPVGWWNNTKYLNKKELIPVPYTNMAAISLFWYTNMAAVTSDENDLYWVFQK
jgi:hypothetical protein